MLSSSRALAHAQWGPVVARIARKSSHALPQKFSFSIAAVRPHPTIILEASEERVQPRSAGRHTARSYATSSQTVQELVTEGRYHEAGAMLVELQALRATILPHPVYVKVVEYLLSQRILDERDHEILSYWLQLLPDAQHANPLFLQGRIEDLRHHTEANPRFITITGRILAQKGYKGLIEDNILPLAREFLENDVFASFEQDLSRALARYISQTGSNSFTGADPSEVFEDASEDYASIMAASVPPPPSILEVVETSLPRILPAPDATDQSVFENEMDEDYLLYQPIRDHHPRKSAAEQLLHLVTTSRYQEAFHFLNELEQLHITIPFSDAYGIVALDVLRRPLSDDFTLEDQLGLFTTWFSLVPLADEPRKSGTSIIQDIRRELMNTSLSNITMMMRFLSILAEKGYKGFVGRQEIGVIMRFASEDQAVSFIHQLEKAYLSYSEKHFPEDAANRMRDFSSQLRSRAIRYLAYSGRVGEAVSLFPEEDSEFQITLYSCEKLLRTVRDTSNPSLLQYLPRIEAMYQQLSATDKSDQLRQLHLKAESETMATQLDTSDPDAYIGKPLPETLRYLKRALRSTKDHPHPSVIAEFLQRYLATGRTRAPTFLLNLSIKSSYRSCSIFLFAEMLYYRFMGQHHLIIKTFLDHFYLSGVPRTDVLKVHDEIERIQNRHQVPDPTSPYPLAALEESEPNILARICNYTGLGPTGLPVNRAWPMKVHCNLVWHALVALTPTDHELESLYLKLLALARGRDPLEFPNQSLQKLRPLLPPSSWRNRIDHAAFTPFMRRLMVHAGPARGSRIIQDMLDLNVQPSVYHYTELAGFYAKKGEAEPAMKILKGLENASGLYERLERQKHDSSHDAVRGLATVSTCPLPTQTVALLPPQDSGCDPSETQVYTAPEPDLVFYTSLMRGFILSKNVSGFERVHAVLRYMKRFLPNKKFYKDQEAILNDVYKDYRAMSRQKGYDYKTKRRSRFVQFMQEHKENENR